MHAYQLVDVATLLALHGRRLVETRARFPDAALELYWIFAKCRHEQWAKSLKQLSTAGRGLAVADPGDGADCEATLDEVLISEVLTRVWAALCHASDRIRGCDEAGPVASSVLSGHQEARHRVLSLMVYGHALGVEKAVGLNKRRLRNERWTDMLLGFVADPQELSSFAFDARRAAEWLRCSRTERGLRQFGQMSILRSVVTALPHELPTAQSRTAELNRRIATSILACFPPAAFDSCGLPATKLQLSLLLGHPDTQGKLNLTPQRLVENGPRSVDGRWLGYGGERFDG